MTVAEFCKSLPKIELHAHLNGSLSEITLKELGCLDESLLQYKTFFGIINKTERTLDECFKIFKITQAATRDIHSVYLATKSVIEEFAEDNVIYLELRTTPRSETGMTKEEYIQSVVNAIIDHGKDINVKLILSIDRRHDIVNSQDSLDVILKMKKTYPDIIKGIDLSGNPYEGNFDKKLFETAKENGLCTAIHCAEIKNDTEVKQVLNFDTDRIGHATFLHPLYGGCQENWELYLQKKIPIECCLTSNVVCETSKNYKEHHIQEWIKEDLPFSINTDDKGVFCTTLSKEYEHVASNFNLSREDMWNIAYQAIDHSFASNEEKQVLKSKMEVWKTQNVHLF